jgi:antitoxin MazE
VLVFHASIQKWGNSQAIRLPKVILETTGLKENEIVQIFTEQDNIIIKKVANRKHKTIKERFKNFDDEYTFEEWNTGDPVGKEVW